MTLIIRICNCAMAAIVVMLILALVVGMTAAPAGISGAVQQQLAANMALCCLMATGLFGIPKFVCENILARRRAQAHRERLMVKAFESLAVLRGAAPGTGRVEPTGYIVWAVAALTRGGPNLIRYRPSCDEWSGWVSAHAVALPPVDVSAKEEALTTVAALEAVLSG